MKFAFLRQLFVIIFCAIALQVSAAPKAELIPFWDTFDQDSTTVVDHNIWQTLLNTVVREGPEGINRVDYGLIQETYHEELRAYLAHLKNFDPRNLNRDQQMAYWINLYNALTIRHVVEHYPVESIKDTGDGFFSFGPWDDEIFELQDQSLTLNDIEHSILRPIWKDPRIHYVVNCASLGCPNLQKKAFTGENLEALMEKAAKEYINHPRGVSIENGDLVLSSIYEWYMTDFNGDLEGVLSHLKHHANPSLHQQLEAFDGDVDYAYDWDLNDVSTSQ